MKPNILAIDQGTSSTRAIIADPAGHIISSTQQSLTQYYPNDGWVEHDAEEIWQSVSHCVQSVLKKAQMSARDIHCLGLTNQRETTVLWDRKTGDVLHRAIVWQDRRTHRHCQQLRQDGIEKMIRAKTGLLLDPYFCATKLAWLLDQVPQARSRAQRGELAFGTIDTFLLWRLSQGRIHATDASNASRTLLFDIHRQQWDEELLRLFDIPASLLPDVYDSNAHFGDCHPAHFGAAIPITGVAGDQHAALIGQACFQAGMVKATYGTGCFLVLNTADKAIPSNQGLITTTAYRINGKVNYCLEGSIFNAGTVIKWLRDQLGLIDHASDTARIAASVDGHHNVYFVPAFTGLGAPYWDSEARGAIIGLTQNTQRAHIIRAALEAVCYQTQDLLLAMQQECKFPLNTLRVDGGMITNDWLNQCLANVTSCQVQKPQQAETTVVGVARLAALGAGLYTSIDELSTLWQQDCHFEPKISTALRQHHYSGWQRAVERVRS